jgi:hypothetical protein
MRGNIKRLQGAQVGMEEFNPNQQQKDQLSLPGQQLLNQLQLTLSSLIFVQ